MTSESIYPEWRTQSILFIERRDQAKSIAYKFIKKDVNVSIHTFSFHSNFLQTGEVNWELQKQGDRLIDLSQFFDDKYYNYVRVEDRCFNDNSSRQPKIHAEFGRE